MDSELPDGKIVRKILSGDRDLFRLLVQRYEKPIFTLCLRILRSREEAEDAAQTAFLKAYTALGSSQSKQSFQTWLYRIATNVCIDFQRRRKVRPISSAVPEDEAPPVLSSAPDPRQAASLRELKNLVHEALDRLEEKYRLPLTLFYIEGLDCARISEILQLPQSTVKTQLQRGRERVRDWVVRNHPDLRLGEVEPL